MVGKPFILLAILLGAFALGGCKPEWWPDSGDRGMPWPPPKPDTWQDPWPPNHDDPQWWVDHFRARNDGGGFGSTHDPDHIAADGFAGHSKFSGAFTWIRDGQRPDCGLFRLERFKGNRMACEPYPAQTIRQFCNEVRNAMTAETECKSECETRNRCRDAKLFRPEMRVLWQCKFLVSLNDVEASCQAEFLCQCFDG